MDRKISKEEKVIALLDYLVHNTDSQHKVSLKDMNAYFNRRYGKGFFGDKHTRKSLILAVAKAFNYNKWGYGRKKEEFRIVYDDYIRDHITEPDIKHPVHQIQNLYFQHIFTPEEIRKIIFAIEHNQNISEQQKTDLINKVKENLYSCHLDDMTEDTDSQIDATAPINPDQPPRLFQPDYSSFSADDEDESYDDWDWSDDEEF